MITTRIHSLFALIATAPRHARALLIAFAVLTFAGSQPGSAQNASAPAEPENWLLVIQGTVVDVGDGTMALDVPEVAVYFSDRPHRVVKPVVLSNYLQDVWADDAEMRQVPPNASLIDENANTIAVIEIFTLEVRDDKHLHAAYTVLNGNVPAVGDVIALTIDGDVNPMITD